MQLLLVSQTHRSSADAGLTLSLLTPFHRNAATGQNNQRISRESIQAPASTARLLKVEGAIHSELEDNRLLNGKPPLLHLALPQTQTQCPGVCLGHDLDHSSLVLNFELGILLSLDLDQTDLIIWVCILVLHLYFDSQTMGIYAPDIALSCVLNS